MTPCTQDTSTDVVGPNCPYNSALVSKCPKDSLDLNSYFYGMLLVLFFQRHGHHVIIILFAQYQYIPVFVA